MTKSIQCAGGEHENCWIKKLGLFGCICRCHWDINFRKEKEDKKDV